MDIPSARRLALSDYLLVRGIVEKTINRAKGRPGAKAWIKYVDLDTALSYAFSPDVEAWVVQDTYLVIFDLVTPWYAKDDVLMLQEVSVWRLMRKGADFSVVPAFLESKAQEAGAVLVCTGTALARTDAALASIYNRFGYKAETSILSKETA